MVSSKSTLLNHLISLSHSNMRTRGCHFPKNHSFINRKYFHQNHPNTLIPEALYPEKTHGGKPPDAHSGMDTKTNNNNIATKEIDYKHESLSH